MRANPVYESYSCSLSLLLLPAAGPKGSHTFCSICFGIEDFTSSPALNLRGSDKSEQCITEGAFFFFILVTVLMVGQINTCILAAS